MITNECLSNLTYLELNALDDALAIMLDGYKYDLRACGDTEETKYIVKRYENALYLHHHICLEISRRRNND